MNKHKKNLLISALLILLSTVFTILVKTVDVQAVGVNGSEIGFAKLNLFIFNLTGTNMIWYHITDWLGFIPIILSLVYAFIGTLYLIKRKSLFKVDKEILALGVLYIAVIFSYVFFENVVINYRPILINGFLEASYPSSHTMMAICLCGSSVIVNKKLFHNKTSRFVNALSIAVMAITVIGRLISGVHWFTDILGGILISASILTLFSSFILKREA